MTLRIRDHPVLDAPGDDTIPFFFNGEELTARKGEMISTALFANGFHTFRRHHHDDAPQGIFCANGQCGQCLVLADGVSVKACLTPVTQGMKVEQLVGLPELPPDDSPAPHGVTSEVSTTVLIVGGGPAGLSAAIELGKRGIRTIIADDKQELGGKLSLQTHNFFGSVRDCMAGTRGMDIGTELTREVEKQGTVDVWLNSPVVGVFDDRKIGIVRNGVYTLVECEVLLIAAGARERALAFHGCDIPGVYGAGAFQTLVNRDLVKTSGRLFIIGGGNVGLIAAYHAMQAGIEVVGLVEALPECGGYKVHLDKIKRLGVPVYTSHTVLEAKGKEHVNGVVISAIDERFRPVPGTEKEFEVDTVLISVGLASVDELTKKARDAGFKVYAAGDSSVIAEASAAIFSGRIEGRRILQDMGHKVGVPPEWEEMVSILRSKPGGTREWTGPMNATESVYPVIRCIQEIPCNPCTEACPRRLISIRSRSISGTPSFSGDCLGCGRCVALCPGLAISLVDKGYDRGGESALVILPWELPFGTLVQGQEVVTSGFEGEEIGKGQVVAIKGSIWQNRRRLVALEVPMRDADLVAGIRIYGEPEEGPGAVTPGREDDDIIICRCERVTKGEIREHIRRGVRDINALKAATKAGLGECGGKTCIPLIMRIFREEDVDPKEVRAHVERPFTQEVPMKAFLEEGGR